MYLVVPEYIQAEGFRQMRVQVSSIHFNDVLLPRIQDEKLLSQWGWSGDHPHYEGVESRVMLLFAPRHRSKFLRHQPGSNKNI